MSPELASQAPEVERGYTEANGLSMYYEIHGSIHPASPPLLLLHGGITTIEASFGAMLPSLVRSRWIIAVEQQGHGRTADIDRPLTFEQMADDTAALLKQLGPGPVDVFGFSDGGNVGFGLAIRHPDLVRKLAVAGTNANNDGLTPGLVDYFKEATPEDMGDEMREAYAAVAPNPEAWPTLVAKVMEQAVAFAGWQPEQLRAITAPVLIMIGDDDIVRPEHAVELFHLIPHARLAVLPHRDHISVMVQPEWTISMVEEFLTAPMPEAG